MYIFIIGWSRCDAMRYMSPKIVSAPRFRYAAVAANLLVFKFNQIVLFELEHIQPTNQPTNQRPHYNKIFSLVQIARSKTSEKKMQRIKSKMKRAKKRKHTHTAVTITENTNTTDKQTHAHPPAKWIVSA